MKIQIPEEVGPFAENLGEEQLLDLLALALYKFKRVAIGKAAKFARLKSEEEFYQLMEQYNVDVNYSPQDFEDDINTLQDVLGEEKKDKK